MKSIQMISGAATLIVIAACASQNQGVRRLKPSSDSSSMRDTTESYGNQKTRMAPGSDTSRRARGVATNTNSPTSTNADTTAKTVPQGSANQIGTPAWWSTHITADGKTKP